MSLNLITCFLTEIIQTEKIAPTATVALPAVPQLLTQISLPDHHPFAIKHDENNFIVTKVVFIADEPTVILEVATWSQYIEQQKHYTGK